jgi:hypothetical protein
MNNILKFDCHYFDDAVDIVDDYDDFDYDYDDD